MGHDNTKAIGLSTVSMACIATVEDTISKIDQYQPIDTSESLRTKSYQLSVTSGDFGCFRGNQES